MCHLWSSYVWNYLSLNTEWKTKRIMNVYDFDGTIYNGDSTIDFYFYCLKNDPSIVRFIPRQGIAFFLYFLRKINKTELKERFFCFLRGLSNVEKAVEGFWQENDCKIFKWYKEHSQPSDIVISASPYFLLKPICDKLQVGELIASKVDVVTGHFEGLNCHGEEKVNLFKKRHPDEEIEEFYSDSTSDSPMAAIANRTFIVKKGVVQPWPIQ